MAAETGFSHTTIRRMWAAFRAKATEQAYKHRLAIDHIVEAIKPRLDQSRPVMSRRESPGAA